MALLGDIAGSVLSAGLDFIGANQQRQFQKGENNRQWDLAQQQMQMQKEFAQNGIRWRVQDAEAAGLHPLAALGTMPSSYSPVQAMFTDAGPTYSEPWSRMGQNLYRAYQAQMSPTEKKMEALKVQNAEKQNDLLDRQIKAADQALLRNQVPPGIPSMTQEVMDPVTKRIYKIPSQEFQSGAASNLPLQMQWLLNTELVDPAYEAGRKSREAIYRWMKD